MSFRPVHPTLTNAMMDTCVMDTGDVDEIEAAKEIVQIADANLGNIQIPYSVREEMKHPKAPADKKLRADSMIFTIPVEQTAGERQQYERILDVLTGNGKRENYAADARHIFEASKYGSYLITTDARIIDKRDELRGLCGITIATPREYLALWRSARN